VHSLCTPTYTFWELAIHVDYQRTLLLTPAIITLPFVIVIIIIIMIVGVNSNVR
jgi:hypothetical protein